MRKWLIVALLVTGIPLTAAADELTRLKEELIQQQAVLQQLMSRIEQLEKKEPTKTEPQHAPRAGSPFNQSKFVPDISFILDTTWVNRDIPDSEYESLQVPGFVQGGHNHGRLPGDEGFNLTYGELVLSAPVDPYFNLYTTLHLSEDSVEIEEAYATTILPAGFQARIGKFRSAFGRINQAHPHAWDFSDAPLIQEQLFGSHGLLEKGVQVTWVAPTDIFLQFGLELLKGENETSFGQHGFELEEIMVDSGSGTDLTTFHTRVSKDFGPLTVLAGISGARGERRALFAEESHEDHEDHLHTMLMVPRLDDDDHDHEHEEELLGEQGDADVFGIDLKLHYSLTPYSAVIFQGEYMKRTIEGSGYTHDEQAMLQRKQAGWYGELIWQMNRSWQTGIRYDQITENRLMFEDEWTTLPEDLDRFSWMVGFNPTEFSRIRFQYSRDKAHWLDESAHHFDQFVLQFTLTIGAHGAHRF